VPRFPSFVALRSDVSEAEESPRTRKSKASKATPKTAAAPSAKSVAAKPAAAATSSSTRRFEYVEGNSSKFWEISVEGADVTVRYGRIGTEGQTKTKSFTDTAAAANHAEKLIEEKTGKGYVEA
jgi:DNA ligase-1